MDAATLSQIRDALVRALALVDKELTRELRRCDRVQPDDGEPCTGEGGHEGDHADRLGRTWTE